MKRKSKKKKMKRIRLFELLEKRENEIKCLKIEVKIKEGLVNDYKSL
jgi:hypothetical protein